MDPPPRRMPCPHAQNLGTCYLIRDFAGVMRGPHGEGSWITRLAQCAHRDPCQKDAEGQLTQGKRPRDSGGRARGPAATATS